MAIVRFEPGARAPSDGAFTLVGHFGEPTGFVCECKAGRNCRRRRSTIASGLSSGMWNSLENPPLARLPSLT